MSKKILTLFSENEFKFKEKGSLFIGSAIPVETEIQAEAELAKIRKKYYDATHNCYAFRLFDESFRYSDDGEPNDTAGIRILNAIKHFQIVNLIIIATRYYGGTKLGVGLLGKAYYDAAYGAINSATKAEKALYNKIEINFEYDMTSNVHHFLNKYEAIDLEQNFESEPKIACFVNPDKIDQLNQKLTEISKGKIKINLIGKNFLK